jgi:hypothetical protein
MHVVACFSAFLQIIDFVEIIDVRLVVWAIVANSDRHCTGMHGLAILQSVSHALLRGSESLQLPVLLNLKHKQNTGRFADRVKHK